MVSRNMGDRLMAMPLVTQRTSLFVPESAPESATDAAPIDAVPAKGGLRAMRREDAPAIEALFQKAFAKGRPTDGLASYIQTVFFDCPHYSEEYGSLVYADGDKGITAALLSMPMPFIVHGRPMMAQLLCAFMSDGTRSGATGAARITRRLSGSKVEFCFTDNASPVSADHWIAGGGITLPVQSLEWRRAFQPLGSLFSGMGCVRRTGKLPPVIAPALRLLDRILVAYKPTLTPESAPGCITRTVPVEAFFSHADRMTQHFAIQPAWTQDYFDWLLRIVAMNQTLGPLHCRTIEKDGRTIGVYLFADQSGTTARVLNFICEDGYEHDGTAQMFASLASEGYVNATGMAQPFMMNSIMRQRRLTFQHRGHFCIQSTHSNLIDAAKTGDLYIGGLASESWSRLVTDF